MVTSLLHLMLYGLINDTTTGYLELSTQLPGFKPKDGLIPDLIAFQMGQAQKKTVLPAFYSASATAIILPPASLPSSPPPVHPSSPRLYRPPMDSAGPDQTPFEAVSAHTSKLTRVSRRAQIQTASVQVPVRSRDVSWGLIVRLESYLP